MRLKDVLEAAVVRPGVVYTAHFGADTHLSGAEDKLPISRGVPIAKAMTDNVLVAFGQNGGPLHPMNGAPLRLVVPGWPGSCSQKWLRRITLRDIVHDGPKMTGTSYRVPSHKVEPGEKVDKKDFEIIERMPVKSLITHPANGAGTGARSKSSATPGRGTGRLPRWTSPTTSGPPGCRRCSTPPSMTEPGKTSAPPWNYPARGYYEVWARATDSAGVMQPHAIDWNPKGYLNNTMHRVALRVA